MQTYGGPAAGQEPHHGQEGVGVRVPLLGVQRLPHPHGVLVPLLPPLHVRHRRRRRVDRYSSINANTQI